MNRIVSVMVVQARDRGTWLATPAFTLGGVFAIAWCIVLIHNVLMGGVQGTYTPGLATFSILVLVGGIGAIGGTYPFAVGFGARRRDFVAGTLAMATAVSAGWALVLGLLSLVEANLLKGWGVGMHFFYLPWFSDGSPLKQFCWNADSACAQADPSYLRGGLPLAQFWVSFIFLLFMSVLGVLLGSIYQRFGRTGEYVFFVAIWLLLSLFLLVSLAGRWWGAILGWLGQQTAAGLAWWLILPMALCALGSYALLRKAAV